MLKQSAAKEQEIVEILMTVNITSNGERLSTYQQVFHAKVIGAFLRATVPLHKLDLFSKSHKKAKVKKHVGMESQKSNQTR